MALLLESVAVEGAAAESVTVERLALLLESVDDDAMTNDTTGPIACEDSQAVTM
jgi:hypothetical protein